MWNLPGFLDLPHRDLKPRHRGLTHVLDKGLSIGGLEAMLAQSGHLVDVIKIGWGVAYVDPAVKERVAMCHTAGVTVCLGGTLLEVCAAQGQVDELRRWAIGIGVDALEVSNGLQAMPAAQKTDLIRSLCTEFTVFAEVGAKSENARVEAAGWVGEMKADLAAGASWLVAEGRESGTVGLYRADGSVRTGLVEAIAARIPMDRIIFEAPRKAQQSWFVRRFGAGVSLGNVPPEEVLPLETLRLGLRADTAVSGVTDGSDPPSGVPDYDMSLPRPPMQRRSATGKDGT